MSQHIDKIPDFDKPKNEANIAEDGLINWTALTSPPTAKSMREFLIIIGTAFAIVGGLEVLIRALQVPSYVFPAPSAIITALFESFDVIGPHILITLQELAIGYTIGAVIGIFLAAVITQAPFIEKIITPYIIILVTTPMLALVPLLVLKLGFGLEPRIVAVALAVGPMVMINSATGFRRTDMAKIALAKSYGASTLQIFRSIRFPLGIADDYRWVNGRWHLWVVDGSRC